MPCVKAIGRCGIVVAVLLIAALGGPPDTVALAGTNPDRQSGTLSNAFSFLAAPPTVTSVNPNSGPTAGGTPVTITGASPFGAATNFAVGTAPQSVAIGDLDGDGKPDLAVRQALTRPHLVPV